MVLVRKLVSIRRDQEEWITSQKFGFNLSRFVQVQLDEHINHQKVEPRKNGS